MSETHAKHPRLEELEAMVRDGRIDTLVVAITDMQGRLMGKRVQAQAFLDGVIDHGAHFCTYLLGTDMEMNTPEGFALMNWDTGYGDWIASPGPITDVDGFRNSSGSAGGALPTSAAWSL